MKVLITGGSGFIGGHLRSKLKALEMQNYDLLEGNDIKDAQKLTNSAKGFDAIVHLAALIRVAECELKPKETLETNFIGTLNVLEAARKNGIKNVVFASSAAIYGEQAIVPTHENVTLKPTSIYAISKIAAEQAIDYYRQKYGLNITSFRIFNVFGQGQDSKSPYAAAIPIFI